MKHSRTNPASLLLPCLLGLVSCFDAGDGTTGEPPPEPAVAAEARAIVPGPVKLMPVHLKSDSPEQQARAAAAPAGAHLNYYGGPVISHAKVVQVAWNSSVRFQNELGQFYTGITNSPYFDWLIEYKTPTQTIGRGTYFGKVVDPSPPGGTNISDAQIQAELAQMINDGTLPPADDDTLYMVHFPPGVTITMQGASSCQQFCGYHGSYSAGNQHVFYGVIPDMGGNCGLGCGFDSAVNNTFVVSSHEVIEAVTDSAVGEAGDNFGPPLAWYDPQGMNGEIGDICNGTTATVAGFKVQKQWSNTKNACIAVNPDVPPPNTNTFSLALAPTSRTVIAGNSVSFNVTTMVTAGTAESLALTVTGLPSGATPSFSPASVNAGSASTLTIDTTASAGLGTSMLTVKATAATSSKTATATLTIQAPPASPPDAGVPDASPPGTPDAGGPVTPGADAGENTETPGETTGGCGCSVGGHAASSGATWLAALAGLGFAFAARRRRRRD